MKRLTWTLAIVVAAGVATAVAQPPGGPGGRSGSSGGQGGGRPPMPVIEALDADRDHVISADELKNATTALLTLDKNSDGKLTENEFAPHGGVRGQEGPQGGGRPGGGRQGGGAERRPPPGGQGGPRGRGPGGGPDGAPPPPSPERMIEHAMEFDVDKDGKLSKDELTKFAEAFHKHHPGLSAPPGGGANGPGRDGLNDGDRPERPRRPD